MNGKNLIENIKSEFGGESFGDEFITFKHLYTEFSFIDGIIYQVIDGKLCGGFEKVNTLKAVIKFVEERV